MLIYYILAEAGLLFLGIVLWFYTTQKGNPAVNNSIVQALAKIPEALDFPPPSVDTIMWLRILALILIAVAVQGNEDVLEEWWDEVIVWIWKRVADFGHIVVFFADLLVPLYNFYATVAAQITTGSYTILAKCQVRTIAQSLVHVGDAMQHLAKTMVNFIIAPKGAFDIYNTTIALQKAVVKQETVVKCACDGLTPAFGILFDLLRPELIANITNETINTLVAVPQTAILAIPPWKEIPDGRRLFHPLKRLAVATGKYLDEAIDNVLARILLAPITDIPIFTAVGYATEGVVGLAEMLAHTATRIILLQPITFNPQYIHISFLNMADNVETSILEILTAVADPLGSNWEGTAKDAARPLTNSIGLTLKALIGLVMSVIDEIYFILRGDFSGLTFMQTLQRWDGDWAETDQKGITLQEHFFQNIDKATYEAQKYFLVWSWIPVLVRAANRLLNMLLRVILSAEDIVQDKFFHKPINCGYGKQEECSDECMFYYDPANPYNPETNDQNPCNVLVTEWVLAAVEDLSDVLAHIFKAVRPQQGDEWCLPKEYPSGNRCARSNSDFMCATSTTLKEAVDVPLNIIRHLFQAIDSVFAEEGDIMPMEIDGRLCDLSTLLYAVAGNAVAILPTDMIPSEFEESLTNTIHAVLVLPVDVIRAIVIIAKYLASIISGDSINWDKTIQNIEDQLINQDYKQKQTATKSISSSVTLTESTANFVVAIIMIPTNYLINIFSAMGDLTGGTNFFSGIAEIVSVLKNSLSKEMVNLVTLIAKVFSTFLAMITQGTADLGDLASDVVTLIQKTLTIVASVASQLLVSILQLLGPVGDFLIVLWRGLCAAGDVIEWLTGADFSSICGAVDDLDDARRRLPEMQSHKVNLTGFDGNSECDLLIHHYNGYKWEDAGPLEQITMLHCAEQQAVMHKINAVLRVDMPTDAIYNWKRKYNMLYEAILGFVVYMKPQSKQQMLMEWDRLEIPRYYLDLWERLHIEIPWIDMIDNAITNTIQPVPELASIYDESKSMLIKAHQTFQQHDMTKFNLPHINMTTLRLGESYQSIVTHHTMAWGLKTDIELDGPLECTVADNFVEAVTDAAERVADYYSGPFVNKALPEFMMWLQDVNITRQDPIVKPPAFAVPTKDSVKNSLLYSFQTCHYEQIMCDPKEQLRRIGRITESLYYILFGLSFLAIVSLLSGLSLFPVMPLVAFLIIMGHTWNYRLTCTPNIPNCFFDDTYLWIKTYQPQTWDQYFPELHKGGQCNENFLWSSAYLLARSPVNFIIEFLLYQSDSFTGSNDYNTYQEWATETPLQNECFILRLPHLVFIPTFVYGVLTFSGIFTYLVKVLMAAVGVVTPLLNAVYAMETSVAEAKHKEMKDNLLNKINNKFIELGFFKDKEV